MDTSKLKKFAQEARRKLLAQVETRLKTVLKDGSLARRESAKTVAALESRIAETSEKQVIEQAAYTWFNRFCALRFMDVNRYTTIGTVSPADGFLQPEILTEAKQGVIDEAWKVDKAAVNGLLDGTKPSSDPQQEAYRLLLVAVCNYYNSLMPFMFEEIADYTELLMPDDLLSDNSVLTDLRQALYLENCSPEHTEQSVEVIGWLYQFYISEKKDDVFAALKKGKKITPENIPAATQLFTPHWIVRYLVENSLGRLWMLNHPESKLAERMDYYIRPESSLDIPVPQAATDKNVHPTQTTDKNVHPTAETDFLRISSPEEIKICDPACGSGHMLTYAFDLLYAIYEEQGYQATDIPRLILTHNLYGIEIDQRAGALAAFALTMKAREKDRRFFSRKRVASGQGLVASGQSADSKLATSHQPLSTQPNICVLENIERVEPEEIAAYREKVGPTFTDDLVAVVNQWEEADNFGSLIRPLVTDVSEVLELLRERQMGEDLFLAGVHQKVLKALRQADYLSPKYHVVVANPPYMGRKGMNASMSAFLKKQLPSGKSDLMAAFILRCVPMTVSKGLSAFVTLDSWMFLSSFSDCRIEIVGDVQISTLVHIGWNSFPEGHKYNRGVAFVLENMTPRHSTAFVNLSNVPATTDKHDLFLKRKRSRESYHVRPQTDFDALPDRSVAYWVSEEVRKAFGNNPSIGEVAAPRKGNSTSDNGRFLRAWQEVSLKSVEFDLTNAEPTFHGIRWVPYNKGGGYRKWYGMNEYLVNWENNGKEIKETPKSVVANEQFFFSPGLTWGTVTSGAFSIRKFGTGFVFDNGGCCVFGDPPVLNKLLGLMNSCVFAHFYKHINPTLNYQSGDVAKVPAILGDLEIAELVDQAVSLVKADWDGSELSWDFHGNELAINRNNAAMLHEGYREYRDSRRELTNSLVQTEEAINLVCTRVYGLDGEVDSAVCPTDCSLFCNPAFKFGSDKSETELEALLLADTMREFISYAVGCMLGRYSLDAPGLILANQGESIEDYYRIVQAKRVASDEGRVTSEVSPESRHSPLTTNHCEAEQSNDSEELSGSDRLAEGDGSGADGLSGDEAVSQGRTLRADKSSPQGGSVSSVKRRGRASEELDSGVSQLSLDSAGLTGGGGNTASDRHTAGIHDEGTTSADSKSSGRSQQNAERTNENTHHSPLTTPHSASISFEPDADNVIPLLDGDWFTDDISERFKEFLKVTFGTEHYEENLTFLENALYPDNGTGKKRKTIRDYFLKEFYNHHIKLYKKRPIYWLFSSPKGTFNALIYMHRYRPDTVSVVLKYLRDFQTKLQSHMMHQQSIADSADAKPADKTKALKQVTQLTKDLKELADYERKVIYPLASQRIEIDLDNGVKHNYPLFGEALKKIAGLDAKEDE